MPSLQRTKTKQKSVFATFSTTQFRVVSLTILLLTFIGLLSMREYDCSADEPTEQTYMGALPRLCGSSRSRVGKEQATLQRERESCEICDVSPALCEEFGEGNLERGRRYQGTGHRIRQALHKANSQEVFKIAVLGGSVSAGHGIDKHQSYIQLITNWFAETFPNTVVEFHNGASPAQGSSYFAACFPAAVPLDVDLVFLESAINDGFDDHTSRMYDSIIRTMLSLSSAPAIIEVDTFSPKYHGLNGGDSAVIVSEAYNVPSFGWRNIVYSQIQIARGIEHAFFGPDTVHPNEFGHRIMAVTVISYLAQQLCRLRRDGLKEAPHSNTFLPAAESHDVAPYLPYYEAWQEDGNSMTPPVWPSCYSTNSINAERLLVPKRQKGWKQWESMPSKKYWISDTPGAQISFDVVVPENGRVAMLRLISSKFGLGNMECWWDDFRDYYVEVYGYTIYPVNIGWPISMPVIKPGPHVLTCEVSEVTYDLAKGGRENRIIAIMDDLGGMDIVQHPHEPVE